MIETAKQKSASSEVAKPNAASAGQSKPTQSPAPRPVSQGSISVNRRSTPASASSSSARDRREDCADANDLLWVDKHRPRTLTEVIGCTDIIKKLR